MSDTRRSRLKVSREGIVLIKSFEGFRPRAVRDGDGGWVIGYGHTASAREGLTVSEQDAELLLQYDLLPVVKALNDQVSIPLNQHQFDALASFAVSVGIERFLASDVLQRLNAGRAGEAADALFGWPERPTPDTALRRRAAERALFVADPAAPIHLADLLAAPLPPPRVPTPAPQTADARAAAVAALLGESAVTPSPPADASRAGVPDFTGPAPQEPAFQPGQAPMHHRFSPYGGVPTGPLPGLPPVRPAPPPEPEPEPFPSTGEPLELTPAGEADFPAEPSADGRPEQGAQPEAEGAELSDDAAPPSVLRHESEPSRAARFDWGEAGAFVIMGLVGLAACGAAAASFRKAMTDDSFIGDFTIIGWVLALIGLTCVGVSSWNLYRRWGQRD